MVRSLRWLYSSARAAVHRLLNELEGRASKFMFRASAKSKAELERSAQVGRVLQNTGRFRVSDNQGRPQPVRYFEECDLVVRLCKTEIVRKSKKF